MADPEYKSMDYGEEMDEIEEIERCERELAEREAKVDRELKQVWKERDERVRRRRRRLEVRRVRVGAKEAQVAKIRKMLKETNQYGEKIPLHKETEKNPVVTPPRERSEPREVPRVDWPGEPSDERPDETRYTMLPATEPEELSEPAVTIVEEQQQDEAEVESLSSNEDRDRINESENQLTGQRRPSEERMSNQRWT